MAWKESFLVTRSIWAKRRLWGRRSKSSLMDEMAWVKANSCSNSCDGSNRPPNFMDRGRAWDEPTMRLAQLRSKSIAPMHIKKPRCCCSSEFIVPWTCVQLMQMLYHLMQKQNDAQWDVVWRMGKEMKQQQRRKCPKRTTESLCDGKQVAAALENSCTPWA